MTLSGQLPKRPFGKKLESDPHTILEYSNVLDINRAWKVKEFKCWIQEDVEALAFTIPGYIGFDVQLSTDEIPSASMWNNAGENRALGWGTFGYNCADNTYDLRAGFTGAPRILMPGDYFIHPDHVVQNKLTISAVGEGADNLVENKPGYTMNYIVYLEEVEITPNESIIFNIKSKAQDLET